MEKSIISFKLFYLFAVLLIFSCSKKDDVMKPIVTPTIVLDEVGANNSKVAYPGQGLHIQATINAPEKIVDVKVQITLATTNYGWDFVNTYTKGYAGLINPDFHEHINIPEDATAGSYTLLVIVTDEAGQKAQHKVDFEIKRDPSLPLINGISLKAIDASMLNLSGTVQASGTIDRIEVEVQSSAWTNKYVYADIDMIGKTSFELNKDIDITGAPEGHYHINVTLYDKAGKTMFYQLHIDLD